MTDYKPNVTKSIDNLNKLEEKINNLQEKSVTYTESGEYIIEPDEEYFALEKVNVNVDIAPAVLQEKEVTITENGETTIEPDEGYNGLSSVNVTTSVENFDVIKDGNTTSGQSSSSYIANKIKKIILTDEISEGDGFGFNLFNGLKNLEEAEVNLKNQKYLQNMFSECVKLTKVKIYNLNVVENLSYLFGGCSILENIDILDLSSPNIRTLQNMFSACPNLTNESLHNILKSLLTLTVNFNVSYKTLKFIGLSSAQATICTSFDEWTTLSANGWTTGY